MLEKSYIEKVKGLNWTVSHGDQDNQLLASLEGVSLPHFINTAGELITLAWICKLENMDERALKVKHFGSNEETIRNHYLQELRNPNLSFFKTLAALGGGSDSFSIYLNHGIPKELVIAIDKVAKKSVTKPDLKGLKKIAKFNSVLADVERIEVNVYKGVSILILDRANREYLEITWLGDVFIKGGKLVDGQQVNYVFYDVQKSGVRIKDIEAALLRARKDFFISEPMNRALNLLALYGVRG